MTRNQLIRKHELGLSPNSPRKVLKKVKTMLSEINKTPNRKNFQHQKSNDLQKTFDISLSYSPIKRKKQKHQQKVQLKKRGRPKKKYKIVSKKVMKNIIRSEESSGNGLPKIEVVIETDDTSLPDDIFYFSNDVEIITEIKLSLAVLNQDQASNQKIGNKNQIARKSTGCFVKKLKLPIKENKNALELEDKENLVIDDDDIIEIITPSSLLTEKVNEKKLLGTCISDSLQFDEDVIEISPPPSSKKQTTKIVQMGLKEGIKSKRIEDFMLNSNKTPIDNDSFRNLDNIIEAKIDLSTFARNKNPICALYEYCVKKKWGPPIFKTTYHNNYNPVKITLHVSLNGIEYPNHCSFSRKESKRHAAINCLKELGISVDCLI